VLPEDVDPRLLDADVRQALRSLSPPVADRVAKHLVMAGQLVDEDARVALTHARAARRLGGRLALVREAAGISAYLAGEWAEALNELRAARRMGGEDSLLHVMADCERALGRPERALDIARGPEIAGLPKELQVEMAIVEAGARRDLEQLDAALLALQGQGLSRDDDEPWTARLWYAYADALVEAGRRAEAAGWFAAAGDLDREETTDAGERLSLLEAEMSTEAEFDVDGNELVEQTADALKPAGSADVDVVAGADAVAESAEPATPQIVELFVEPAVDPAEEDSP
jgi:tetratricopeptide (TPR) repeat protein